MPQPRAIIVDNRESQVSRIENILTRQASKLDAVINDLSKPHVDDKTAAKRLLGRAKTLRKKLPS